MGNRNVGGRSKGRGKRAVSAMQDTRNNYERLNDLITSALNSLLPNVINPAINKFLPSPLNLGISQSSSDSFCAAVAFGICTCNARYSTKITLQSLLGLDEMTVDEVMNIQMGEPQEDYYPFKSTVRLSQDSGKITGSTSVSVNACPGIFPSVTSSGSFTANADIQAIVTIWGRISTMENAGSDESCSEFIIFRTDTEVTSASVSGVKVTISLSGLPDLPFKVSDEVIELIDLIMPKFQETLANDVGQLLNPTLPAAINVALEEARGSNQHIDALLNWTCKKRNANLKF